MAHDKGPAVGYRRPPRHSQFKKGQSGNPRGRRKGSKSFAAAIRELMDRMFRVTINSEEMVVSGRQALALMLVNRAVGGDLRPIQILLRNDCMEPAERPTIILIDEGDAKL